MVIVSINYTFGKWSLHKDEIPFILIAADLFFHTTPFEVSVYSSFTQKPLSFIWVYGVAYVNAERHMGCTGSPKLYPKTYRTIQGLLVKSLKTIAVGHLC